MVVYAPTECAADSDERRFWSMLLDTVASVPRKDNLFVLMGGKTTCSSLLGRDIGVEAWNTPM